MLSVLERKAVPFVCRYLFELCGESRVAIQPTSSQCEQLNMADKNKLTSV